MAEGVGVGSACCVAFGVAFVVALGVAFVVALFVGAGAVAVLVADGVGVGVEATGAGVDGVGAGVDGVVLPPSALPVELLELNCGGVIAKTAPNEPMVPTPMSSPRFISLSLLSYTA